MHYRAPRGSGGQEKSRRSKDWCTRVVLAGLCLAAPSQGRCLLHCAQPWGSLPRGPPGEPRATLCWPHSYPHQWDAPTTTDTALSRVLPSAFLAPCRHRANKSHEPSSTGQETSHLHACCGCLARAGQHGKGKGEAGQSMLGEANHKIPRKHEARRAKPEQNPPSRRSRTAGAPFPSDLLLP